MNVCTLMTFKPDFLFLLLESNLIKKWSLLKSNLFIAVKIVPYKYSIEYYKITMII